MARKKEPFAAGNLERLKGMDFLKSAEGDRRGTHSLEEGVRVTASEKHILLDPNEVGVDGYYVRDVEEERSGVAESVDAAGTIDQAIGVRRVGTPFQYRYALVYGLQRLTVARRKGLEKIEAKDYGFLEEREALLVMMRENEARSDPSYVRRAIAYHRLVHEMGYSQAEVARHFGRNRSYAHWLSKAGEALVELSEEERGALAREPTVSPRLFQDLAPKELSERIDALRAIVRGDRPKEARRRKAPSVSGPFAVRRTRTGGYTLRAQWTDEQLFADPEGLREQAREAWESAMRELWEVEEERMRRRHERLKKGNGT